MLKSPFGPVKEGRDYIYLYDEALTAGAPAEVVVLYDAAELEQDDGAEALFADGHVDWVERTALNDAIKRAPALIRAEKK